MQSSLPSRLSSLHPPASRGLVLKRALRSSAGPVRAQLSAAPARQERVWWLEAPGPPLRRVSWLGLLRTPRLRLPLHPLGGRSCSRRGPSPGEACRGPVAAGAWSWRLEPHQGLCRLRGWEVDAPGPGPGLGLAIEAEARLSWRSAGRGEPHPFPVSLRKPQPGALMSEATEAPTVGTQGAVAITGVLGSSAGAQSPGLGIWGCLDLPEAGTLGVWHLGGA